MHRGAASIHLKGMHSEFQQLSAQLADTVEAVAGAVVAVDARSRYPSSGVFWNANAIVTAAHTVQREEDIAVTLPDGRRTNATFVGRDAGTDLAVLRISEPAGQKTLGQAAVPKPGHLSLAIGRSPDSGPNATLGIISGVSGQWRTWRGGLLDHYIRLDLTLFPGSSGGAVVNTECELIGIATSALSRIAGLAIPVSTVARVTEELLTRGYVRRGYLGVGLQAVARPSGLIILSTDPEGPAAQSGLIVGDVLTALDGKAITDIDDLQNSLAGLSAGHVVKATIIRGGSPAEVPVTVAEWPAKKG